MASIIMGLLGGPAMAAAFRTKNVQAGHQKRKEAFEAGKGSDPDAAPFGPHKSFQHSDRCLHRVAGMSVGDQASRVHPGTREVSRLLIGPLLLSAVFLAGCGDKQGEGPTKPGIYAYEGPDGVQHRMIFSEDGTYSDMQDNVPKPVEQGEWLRRDGQLCLISRKTGTELCLKEKAEANGGFSLSGNGITTRFRLKAGGR